MLTEAPTGQPGLRRGPLAQKKAMLRTHVSYSATVNCVLPTRQGVVSLCQEELS
jgi:hypothetical protein